MRLTARPGPPVRSKIPHYLRPNGQAICYFYYDDDPHSRPVNKRFASPHPERRPILLAAA
jgi:hypothetical protein